MTQLYEIPLKESLNRFSVKEKGSIRMSITQSISREEIKHIKGSSYDFIIRTRKLDEILLKYIYFFSDRDFWGESRRVHLEVALHRAPFFLRSVAQYRKLRDNGYGFKLEEKSAAYKTRRRKLLVPLTRHLFVDLSKRACRVSETIRTRNLFADNSKWAGPGPT